MKGITKNALSVAAVTLGACVCVTIAFIFELLIKIIGALMIHFSDITGWPL